MAETKFDKPQDQPLFMGVPKQDPQLLAAAQDAQKSLPAFRTLIKSPPTKDDVPLVKTYLAEGGGLWLWLMVTKDVGTEFEAETFEAPRELPSLKRGTRKRIANLEVADWMIISNGVVHGGYSLRLQRQRLPESERASFDRYVGAREYAPLPR